MSPVHGFFLLGILICAYSAQAWAKKCHDELKVIREELQRRNAGE